MESYVSFPELGWTLPISDELVSISLFGIDISIKWYGLLIAVGFLLAILYGFRRAKEFELQVDPLIDVILVCTLVAFIGARLYYVLFSEDRAAYFDDPITILYVWKGGLAIFGGVIGAFTTALWMCPLRKVNLLRAFDLAAPGFLIGQAIGRWGNFFNQEAFGGNTTLPWGMTGNEIANKFNGISGYDHSLPVHPTFLYESLWCLLGLLLIHIVSKKAYKFKGQLFCMYLMWYGFGRFFIEQLRTDSLYVGTMRTSCVVAVLSVVGGLALFFILKFREQRTPKDLFAEEATIPLGDELLYSDEEEAESDATDVEAEQENEQAIDAEETTDGNEN